MSEIRLTKAQRRVIEFLLKGGTIRDYHFSWLAQSSGTVISNKTVAAVKERGLIVSVYRHLFYWLRLTDLGRKIAGGQGD